MMHLTNYSVNKASAAFVQNTDGQGEDGEELEDAAVDGEGRPVASKWSLTELRLHFEREGMDFKAMFDAIKDLVIKTLIAVEEPMQVEWHRTLGCEEEGWAARGASGAHRGSCFELYGFDVLVDANLKPWLLEVNICPSLSSGSPLDKRIKTKVVADVLTLSGVHPPTALWKLSPESVNWPTGATGKEPCLDENEAASGCTLPADEMAKRARKLAACSSPQEALAMFDETAWELVIESHEEDMRSGGLERIFPGPNSGQYVRYCEQETYCNCVLRLFHEAGGGEIFRSGSRKLLPTWVPRQVSFSKT